MAWLFGMRIGGSSNDSTSSGPGIGFVVVLLPELVETASRLGPLVEYLNWRVVENTSCGELCSVATRNQPDICTLTGPAEVS